MKPVTESKSNLDEVTDWCAKIRMVLSWAQQHSNGHHTISNTSVVSQVSSKKLKLMSTNVFRVHPLFHPRWQFFAPCRDRPKVKFTMLNSSQVQRPVSKFESSSLNPSHTYRDTQKFCAKSHNLQCHSTLVEISSQKLFSHSPQKYQLLITHSARLPTLFRYKLERTK